MHKLIANQAAYEALSATLRGGRLSHALLIEGPAGCGKSTFAAEVAQAALCSAESGEVPCGVCRDCIKVEKGIHPDLLQYRGEGGSRSFHIDTVRALRQQAFVRPNEAARKVILLQNTQEMSVQAQNALLKIIEEPPKNVHFILTCENRTQMLETIRSRVQVIPLEAPGINACAEHLRGRFPEREPAVIAEAARKAGGIVGQALAILESDSGSSVADGAAVEILYNACIGSELDALAALQKYERNRTGLTALLEGMAAVLREELLRPGEDPRLGELSSRSGRLRLLQILAIIEDTVYAVSQNANGLLLVTSVCSRIRSVLAEG